MARDRGTDQQFEIDSAGTYGGHRGEKADPRMRQAAAARGYELTSRSRQITSDDFERFDMIIVMDDNNYETVHRLAPSTEASGKIFRMSEFCRDTGADHVPDPYYEGARGFERVLDIIEDGCRGLMDDIKNGKV